MPMFRARVRMEVLRELVGVVSTLVPEMKLVVSKDGVEVKAVDPSHVAMLVAKLKKEAFEEFQGDTTEIGLDLEKVREVLALARPGDVLDVTFDAGKGKLVVSVGKLSRMMSVVDPAGISQPKVPSVNPTAKVVLKIDELRQGIRGSESISDHVTLSLDHENFTLHSEGENDQVNLKIGKEALTLLDAKEPVKSMYPLDFFSNMVKSITSAEEVTMALGTQYPLRLDFSLAGGRGDAQFLLAPRVEDSD
ncbi:MAG: DNA polymerase sliding clamp [Euryarchaeota archaeon]|nr:DNA polymerase sliding clamp [Euryarchaeota archaeon]MDE1835700.1 DNA polymerase sliding clamp [Euryarchaeota archaeon]MDE1880438.1 DNA polymerase sliding clamp [Euryarchaeota archaeon]MDE2043890.1 DNA polymerase sliding clamp [Thermoplasmata archaeon]